MAADKLNAILSNTGQKTIPGEEFFEAMVDAASPEQQAKLRAMDHKQAVGAYLSFGPNRTTFQNLKSQGRTIDFSGAKPTPASKADKPKGPPSNIERSISAIGDTAKSAAGTLVEGAKQTTVPLFEPSRERVQNFLHGMAGGKDAGNTRKFSTGMAEGLAQAGIDMSSPANILAMFAGVGEVKGASKVAKIGKKLAQAYFAGKGLEGLADDFPDAADAYKKGDMEAAGKATAKGIADLLVTFTAGKGLAGKTGKRISAKIGQEIKEPYLQGKYGPAGAKPEAPPAQAAVKPEAPAEKPPAGPPQKSEEPLDIKKHGQTELDAAKKILGDLQEKEHLLTLRRTPADPKQLKEARRAVQDQETHVHEVEQRLGQINKPKTPAKGEPEKPGTQLIAGNTYTWAGLPSSASTSNEFAGIQRGTQVKYVGRDAEGHAQFQTAGGEVKTVRNLSDTSISRLVKDAAEQNVPKPVYKASGNKPPAVRTEEAPKPAAPKKPTVAKPKSEKPGEPQTPQPGAPAGTPPAQTPAAPAAAAAPPAGATPKAEAPKEPPKETPKEEAKPGSIEQGKTYVMPKDNADLGLTSGTKITYHGTNGKGGLYITEEYPDGTRSNTTLHDTTPEQLAKELTAEKGKKPSAEKAPLPKKEEMAKIEAAAGTEPPKEAPKPEKPKKQAAQKKPTAEKPKAAPEPQGPPQTPSREELIKRIQELQAKEQPAEEPKPAAEPRVAAKPKSLTEAIRNGNASSIMDFLSSEEGTSRVGPALRELGQKVKKFFKEEKGTSDLGSLIKRLYGGDPKHAAVKEVNRLVKKAQGEGLSPDEEKALKTLIIGGLPENERPAKVGQKPNPEAKELPATPVAQPEAPPATAEAALNELYRRQKEGIPVDETELRRLENAVRQGKGAGPVREPEKIAGQQSIARLREVAGQVQEGEIRRPAEGAVSPEQQLRAELARRGVINTGGRPAGESANETITRQSRQLIADRIQDPVERQTYLDLYRKQQLTSAPLEGPEVPLNQQPPMLREAQAEAEGGLPPTGLTQPEIKYIRDIEEKYGRPGVNPPKLIGAQNAEKFIRQAKRTGLREMEITVTGPFGEKAGTYKFNPQDIAEGGKEEIARLIDKAGNGGSIKSKVGRGQYSYLIEPYEAEPARPPETLRVQRAELVAEEEPSRSEQSRAERRKGLQKSKKAPDVIRRQAGPGVPPPPLREAGPGIEPKTYTTGTGKDLEGANLPNAPIPEYQAALRNLDNLKSAKDDLLGKVYRRGQGKEPLSPRFKRYAKKAIKVLDKRITLAWEAAQSAEKLQTEARKKQGDAFMNLRQLWKDETGEQRVPEWLLNIVAPPELREGVR